MAPLPFPLPFNVGTDICRISRIYRVLASPRGSRFLERILTSDERRASIVLQRANRESLGTAAPNLFSGAKDVGETGWAVLKREQPELWKRATFLAGRFAAKEATFKAHPTWSLGFQDVVILRTSQVATWPSAARQAEETSKEPATDVRFSPGHIDVEQTEQTLNGSGPPVAVVTGRDGRQQLAQISISHDGDYATAVCLGFEASDTI